ncbi:CvpA family protein [Oscillibacter sp. MSJ-2]|uniref:CvpA family protein n=1 Tax=Dysosmobacter acutus TaxID=2841504 RepID=A0ABS6FB58_9FIRM|nr:CvpA family protein [Dysosmobacter acutus]MBU5626891.1 CvpA family protein [Dysosmobacter acutus]
MNQAVIIDLCLLAVLLCAFFMGARRGLFRSLAGLVVIVVSLVCATLLANVLTEPVMEIFHPMLEAKLEQKVDRVMDGGAAATDGGVTMPESGPDPIWEQARQLLQALGMGDHQAGSLADRVQEKVRDTGMEIASAVGESLLYSIIHGILFVLSFVVVLFALRLVVAATDLALKLPGLHFLNSAGGGLLGMGEGFLLLFLAVWALEQFGVSFSKELVESTYLLELFVTKSPLDLLSSL